MGTRITILPTELRRLKAIPMKHPSADFTQVAQIGIASLAAIATLLAPVLPTIVHAQVTTTITSSGLNTVVTQNGNVQNITGGTRVGSNLFQSFGQFKVGAGDIANFQNTLVAGTFPVTSNILGRVTGGQPSQIFGTLRTTNFGNANLFLINPKGVIFGPTASLDIGATSVSGTPRGAGSFYATTADYVRLGSGATSGYFYADAARDSILTSVPVTAFGFLGSSPGAITVQGSQLSVANGQTIGLVGGNIEIQAGTVTDGTTVTSQAARLSAPNGQIQLSSATSPGEFSATTLQPRANVDGSSFTSYGSITLTADSSIHVSGTNTVSIRGGQFVLSVNDAALSTAVAPATTETLVLANGSSILASTQGSSSTGDIDITAKTVQLNGSTIRTESLDPGTGDAGDITIAASDTLSLSASGITSLTSGGGTGGTINVTGRPSVSLKNGSSLLTQTIGNNSAGDVNLTVANLTMTGGSGIESVGSDSASSGSIAINAIEAISLSASRIVNRNEGFGGTGGIAITAKTLNLTDSSIIRSDTFFGPEEAEIPKIAIVANDEITISSDSGSIVAATLTDVGAVELSSPSITIAERGFIETTTGGPGNAGAVTLRDVRDLQISNGGKIRSSAEQDSGFGGAISVTASGKVSISGIDSGIFSESSSPVSTAQGGNISVSAQQIEVTNGGAISTKTTFAGNAGDITLKANSLKIESGGQLTSSSAPRAPFFQGDEPPIPTGNAGSIALQGLASPAASILISGSGSGFFTETQGTGTGGNISVRANLVQLNDSATISAKTTNTGNAGNILIKTDTFNMGSGATVTAASTGSGNAGTVTVEGTNSPANSVVIDGSGTGIFTDTQASGKGGDIAIDTRTLTMQNGGMVSAATSGTDALATGGNITITASQSVDLRSNASASASSTGLADAGNISINAGNRFEARNSSVTTRSDNAGGGNIEINARDRIRLVNSQVNASAFLNGGNVSIDPNLVILQNSSILAQAIQGNGGNITIFTPLFLADSSSLVSASSQFGLNGTVTIQSPTSNLSGSLGTLASKPRQAQSLLTQRCAALANGQASSFVVAGREQLPADPGGWLTSPLALAGLDADPFREETVAEGTSNLAPRTSGLLANGTVSLRRLTPAGFLIASFAESETTGRHS